MLCTWFLTVVTSMNSLAAISLFESPSAMSSRISASRAVRRWVGRGRAAASAWTRLTSTVAIHGEQAISSRATLSIVVTRVSSDSSLVT